MQDAFAHCEALVRAGDKDRFLASLFAPADRRGALLALYAFHLEIARVREVVRDPLAGEIRLQWWSDVLTGEGRGDIDANPVASALRATVERYRLPVEALTGLIEARRFDLYQEPMQSLAELEAYGSNVFGVLFAQAARVLAGGADPNVDGLAREVGAVQAITRLVQAFPRHAARGQVYVPLDILQRHGASGDDATTGPATPALRQAFADLRELALAHLSAAGAVFSGGSAAIVPALLPLAVARAVFDRMARRDFDPFVPIDLPQWRRQWLIWRAARKPARIFA